MVLRPLYALPLLVVLIGRFCLGRPPSAAPAPARRSRLGCLYYNLPYEGSRVEFSCSACRLNSGKLHASCLLRGARRTVAVNRMRPRPSSARTPAVVAAAPASSANGHRRSGSDVRVQQSAGSSWRIVQLLRRALSTVVDGHGHSSERWEKASFGTLLGS